MTALATATVQQHPTPVNRSRAARKAARAPRAPRIGLTQSEVAADLGISQQTVAETEQRALRKCRLWCEQHGLKLDDLIRDDHWNDDAYQDEKSMLI